MPGIADEDYCYLTTRGRASGNPHTIEIWFGLEGSTLYVLAGDHASDWVRNLQRTPAVSIRIGERTFEAQAHTLAPDSAEDALARRLLFEKYSPRHDNDLEGWRRDALPVAFDLGVALGVEVAD
jgi:deazaflavin-dependent oxidoreductase (nitroreductase family)